MSNTIVKLTRELVATIADQFVDSDLDVSAFEGVRQKFPGVRITHCFDDDIVSGKPVFSRRKFAVYLVGGDEHCLTLTNDFEIAIGVVIAEILEDD